MKQSKLFSLNLLDVLKAFLIASLTGALQIISVSLQAGQLNFDWKNIGLAALSGGVAYLVKNFFTPSDAQKQNSISDQH